MKGKVCVVTGANSGLGLITARELASKGADVILLCRDRAKGEAAMARIRRNVPAARLELLVADFASLGSVSTAAEQLRSAGRPIHVLVNNAGLMLTERQVTEDGFEHTFAVNHLAPFLLTQRLIDTLEASGSARIVTVASRAHMRSTLDWDDLQSERSFSGWTAYCRSKLCNVLFNLELARRLQGSSITANCLHPGVIATGFGRENNRLWRLAMRLARPFMTSPEEGAKTQIHLASSPDVEGRSGLYFVDCRPAAPSAAGSDPEAAQRLWEISERLVAQATKP